jgi:hypothetical protein
MNVRLSERMRQLWIRRPPTVTEPSRMTGPSNAVTPEAPSGGAEDRESASDSAGGQSGPPADRPHANGAARESPPPGGDPENCTERASMIHGTAEAPPPAPPIPGASDELTWPSVGSSSHAGAHARTLEMDARPMTLQPADRHQADVGDTDVGREAMIDELEPGRWLPIRDAVREIGSLERLYRLAQNGELRSREPVPEQIEIWVTDRDRLDGAPQGVRGIASVTEATVPSGPGAPEPASQIATLLAHVVDSQERHLQTARENGVLSERASAVERELRAVREAFAADKQALETAQQRLEAVLGANVALTELLQLRTLVRDGEPRRGRERRWPQVWLAIIASLAAAAVAMWLWGPLPFPFV